MLKDLQAEEMKLQTLRLQVEHSKKILPVSTACKQLVEYSAQNLDPLVTINGKPQEMRGLVLLPSQANRIDKKLNKSSISFFTFNKKKEMIVLSEQVTEFQGWNSLVPYILVHILRFTDRCTQLNACAVSKWWSSAMNENIHRIRGELQSIISKSTPTGMKLKNLWHGSFSESRDKHQKKQSKTIDNNIKTSKAAAAPPEILLLGGKKSGKTTFFTQLQVLAGKLTIEDRMACKQYLHNTCVSQMQRILKAARKLDIKLANPANNERMERILDYVPSPYTAMEYQIAEDIKKLWEDEGIIQVYSMRDVHYSLGVNAAYLFNMVDNLKTSSYVPSVADIMQLPSYLNGVQGCEFHIKSVSQKVIDSSRIGGQRRKWIHYFEGVSAVLFLVSLDEYDMTVENDKSQNRLMEALTKFIEIVTSVWFLNSVVVLLFSKVDLFKEKLKRVDMKIFFPDYHGGAEYKHATEYIQQQFLDKVPAERQKSIFTHYVCSISDESVGSVMQSLSLYVLAAIVKDILKK